METLDCIRTRASVRDFRADPIPDNILERILESGVRAPSAGNVQDWEYVVVSSKENKKRLAQASYDQSCVEKAPVVVVVCSHLARIERAYGERGRSLYSVQDTAASCQNMILAAWDQGVGSVWVGAFDEEEVRQILILPEDVRPLAMLLFGYPKSRPKPSQRMETRGFVHFERF